MLRTQQAALIHQTNVDFTGIRSMEIRFFNSFYAGFGTQATLVAGLALNCISQTMRKKERKKSLLHLTQFVAVAACIEDCPNPFWQYFYWIFNSLASGFGFVAVLIALYTNVYGQGMALRGPVGSMVQHCVFASLTNIVYCLLKSLCLTLFTFSSYATCQCQLLLCGEDCVV